MRNNPPQINKHIQFSLSIGLFSTEWVLFKSWLNYSSTKLFEYIEAFYNVLCALK